METRRAWQPVAALLLVAWAGALAWDMSKLKERPEVSKHLDATSTTVRLFPSIFGKARPED